MAQKVGHPSLSLAFLGDAVFELMIRERALAQEAPHVDKLNRYTKRFSRAGTQAVMADALLGSDALSDEEMKIFKRGRNAKSTSVPKSCSPIEYRKATALETLFGYLYLSGEKKRLKELFDLCMEQAENG